MLTPSTSAICWAKAFIGNRPSLRMGLHCENLKFRRFAAAPLTSCLPASLIIASLSLMTESARPSEGRSSRGSRLGPPLNVELEHDWAQKAGLTQYLRAIRKKLHDESLRNRIRFC